MLYDPATKTSKLFDRHHADGCRGGECAARRGSHGLDQPARAGWRNAILGRWQDDALQRRRGPVPDPHRHCQVGATDQDAGRGTGRQTFARRPYGRVPARLGPLHGGRGFRQGDAAHARRHRDAAQRHSRLGVSRGTEPGHRLLVVAGFEVALLPAVRFQPRAGVSARRYAGQARLLRARTLSASRREQSRRASGRDCRHRRSHQMARGGRHAQRIS